jgi:DNA-binding transcriptional ArsR family regulator
LDPEPDPSNPWPSERRDWQLHGKQPRPEASITDLAEKFNMTLTGMKKHIGVLEQAGLVISEKVGRVRTCKVGPDRLEEATAWLEKYRQLWAARFDELDRVIEELKQRDKFDGRKKRK